jgi:hypothetical protein
MRRSGELQRGGELRRTAWPLAQGQYLRRTQGLARGTYHPPPPRRLAAEPAGAKVCQAPASGAPGPCWGGLHRHHRLPRGRGGPDTPENLLWLCAAHHDWTHGHPLDGRRLGLLA